MATQAEIIAGPHKMVDGVAVPLTDAELTDFNSRLDTWNAGTTDRLRQQKKTDAAAQYDAKIAAGFNYTQDAVTKNVQIDDASQGNIEGISSAHANGVWTAEADPNWQGWRCTDNSFMPIATTDQFIAFAGAVMAYVKALKKTRWTHVDNLTKPTVATYVADADVETYDVTTGWPAN